MTKRDKWLIAVVVSITALFYGTIFSTTSWGASVTKHIGLTSHSARLDSIVIVLDSAGTIVDSGLVTSGITDTALTLDDAADWVVYVFAYWDGDGNTYTDAIIPFKLTAGVASVSIDYDSIALAVLGGGSDTLVFYAIDTSGTDTARQDVKLTVYNSAGAEVVNGWTNAGGNKTFYLDDGAYTVVGRATGYIWNSLACTVSVNDDSVAVLGYNQIIGNPSAANLSRIYGWIYDIKDDPVRGASITITRNNSSPVVDSSGTGSVVISPNPIIVFTDTAGYWFADVRRTQNYDDTTRGFYDIVGNWRNKELFKINKLYVPATGNINLGDTLAQRIN